MRTHVLPSFFDRVPADYDGTSWAPTGLQAVRPSVDLAETAEHYEIVADLPGVDREAVEVEFEDGVLEIRAERATEAAPEDSRLLRRERPSGRYLRRVAFREDVEVDAIDASLKDGVLRVRIPKAENRRPRQIPVDVH